MSFEKGTTALTVFRMNQQLPEDYLDRIRTNAAPKLDLIRDEQSVGWTVGVHILDDEITDESIHRGDYIHLNLRVAERKIPAKLLKSLVKKHECRYMKEEGLSRINSKKRKELRQEVIEAHTYKMTPIISGCEVVIDNRAKLIYFGSASRKQADLFVSMFLKTFSIEPIQINFWEIMFRLFQKNIPDLPGISFSGRSETEQCPELDFLTWLWFYSETLGERASAEYREMLFLIFDGPMVFAFPDNDAKGAGEITAKKGCPSRSAEAKAALAVGKKLRKARITISNNGNTWSGTFDADHFTFTGLKLPDGEEMDPTAVFNDRIQALFDLNEIMQKFFCLFVNTLQCNGWPSLEAEIQQWAAEHVSL